MVSIEVGRHAGFCRGVKHAVDEAFACAREADEEILTDGELIHNPQTLELLDRHGVRVLSADDDLERARGRLVVVRAHGVTPQRLAQLKAVARDVRNLTCRDVGRVQATIRRHRGSVVIFGKPDHPEVRGLLGFARDGHTVRSVEEVAGLPQLEDVLLVSQTTMNREAFTRVAEAVRARYPGAHVADTICDATELRQNEVREMARRNDCVLVIGGSSSSNTRRLHEIASELTAAHLVSDVEEVRRLPLAGCRSIGITAGASTPDWQIQEVVEEVRRATRGPATRALVGLLSLALHGKLVIALGAFLLSLAVADNLGLPFSVEVAVLGALYYVSMSLLNAWANRRALRLDNPGRHRQLTRWRWVLGGVFVLSSLTLLAIAFHLGRGILILTLFSLALGVVYNLAHLPLADPTRRLLLLRQSELLALKSVVIAFAVSVLLNGLPVVHHFPRALHDPSSAAAVLGRLGFSFSLVYVFLLIFTRQSLFEIKTAQSDRIAGVSSLLDVMSGSALRGLLFALPAALLVAMLAGVVSGDCPPDKTRYLVAVGYDALVVALSRNRTLLASPFAFELLVESNLYVAGLIALL